MYSKGAKTSIAKARSNAKDQPSGIHPWAVAKAVFGQPHLVCQLCRFRDRNYLFMVNSCFSHSQTRLLLQALCEAAFE